jgi:hypothetical protein
VTHSLVYGAAGKLKKKLRCGGVPPSLKLRREKNAEID